MLHILYTGRNLRARRRETVTHPPQNVVYTTQFPIADMPPDHKLTGRVQTQTLQKLALKAVEWLQVPNLNFLPKKLLTGINLIHTPGQLILNNKPYVVEIDNVACLAFYKLSTLFGWSGRRIIKSLLKKNNCKKIICISEGAKHSMANFFKDLKITEKCVISYPFVSDKGLTTDAIQLNEKTKLLYISSDFYLKGGRELLHAYIALQKKYPDIELTIICKRDTIEQTDKALIDTTNITLVEATVSKEVLYADYYLTHDIFVCPTYKDSFGLVFLEALSCGLAIVGTDMFAVKEMVIDGYNGTLIQSPLSVFTDDYLPNTKRWDVDIARFAIDNPSYFTAFTHTLTNALDSVLHDKTTLLQYKQNSLKLFQEKFHDTVRTKQLQNIYLDALK